MIVTHWPNLFRANEGRQIETTTEAFMARVLSPKSYRFENLWPRYSIASFTSGHRCLDAFRFAEAVMLDLDRDATRETIETTFSDCCGPVHTTKRHTPEAQRWRVVVYADRCIDGDEFPRVWRAVVEVAERGGLAPDYAARDASRCWAAPSAGPHYQAFELCGALFNVDRALARFPAPSPPERSPYTPSSDDVSQRFERARRYLAAMDPALSGSGGHTATFRAATALVVGFALPPDAALDLLATEFNPRCSPPWSLRELRHKITNAAKRSTRPHGWLADRPIERRSA
jgi:hypothetical protein